MAEDNSSKINITRNTPYNLKKRALIAGVIVSLSICGLVLVSNNINSSLQNSISLRGFEEDEAFLTKEYMEFLAKYGKTHASKDDLKHRFNIFKRNYQKMMEHNSLEDAPFEMGINEFSDLTDEELEETYLKGGLLISPERIKKLEAGSVLQETNDFLRPKLKQNALPDSVNWYSAGKVTRPYNQKSCGSCWAFSATACLESLAFISGHDQTLQEYSVQQLVDCDITNFGCGGGWMYDAYTYASQNGIALKQTYQRQYAGKRKGCLFNETQSHFKNIGMIEQDNNSNDQMKELVSKQPVAIAMYASAILMRYKKGIVTDEYLKCSSQKRQVNHGVVLVGYGKFDAATDKISRGTCSEYWIIRNSWGANWGEEGFFRLCMDNAGAQDRLRGTCLVNSFATWPNMEGTIIPPTD